MSGKLLLHIGPPKTATTSLQYLLSDPSLQSVRYRGVQQPRTPDDRSIAADLYRACQDPNTSKASFLTIRQRISSELEETPYLFLSEEMFLLHSRHCSVGRKLQTLADITAPFNSKVIFAVRETSAAIPSFYQEIYPNLEPEFQQKFSLFEQSPYTEPYRYRLLVETLVDCGFSDIHWFNFDQFVKGNCRLAEIIGEPMCEGLDQFIQPKNWHQSRTSHGKRVLVRKNLFEKCINKVLRHLPVPLGNNRVSRSLVNFARSLTATRAELQVSAMTQSGFQSDVTFLKQLRWDRTGLEKATLGNGCRVKPVSAKENEALSQTTT